MRWLRYSSINQALHWLTALCMFAILPLAWVMTNMPTDAPSRAAFALSDMQAA